MAAGSTPRHLTSVSSAFKMPKETTEQKQARSLAIQKGIMHCAEVPLANAQKCREVSNLADRLAEKFNLNAASDLQCAQYLAAGRAEWLRCKCKDQPSSDKGSIYGPEDRG